MTNVPLARVLRRLRGLFDDDGADAPGDAAHLARFVAARDGAAFAELVRRHGPLVLRVCRQVLRHEQDAEDAFQAVFLVLARKAASVRRRDALGGWLHRVALHVALDARARAGRRRLVEQQVAAMPPADAPADPDRSDLWPVLHEEVDRLPAKYRLPVVLCYLDGRTNEEAARRLRCPVGTVKVRLSRARDLLRRRLTRRGAALAAAALGLLAAESARAALSPALVEAAARAAVRFAAGAAGAVPAPAAALAKGVLRSMFVRKLKIIASVLLVLAVGAGFGFLRPPTRAADPAPPAGPAAAAPAGAAPADQPAPPADPEQGKVDRAAVVKGNTDFAFDLYGRLGAAKGNVFFSPYSVSTALAMTYAGARGNTAAQMEKTLHFPVGPDRLHPAFAALAEETAAEGKAKGYQFRTANSLWGQKGYGFQPAFLKTGRDHYGAGLQEVDFRNDAEGARKTINEWVKKQTEDKIKDLLPPGILDDEVRMVLTNAVYFKAEWDSKFRKGLTTQQSFHTADGAEVKTPLMEQDGTFKYLQAETFQAVELPYKGGDVSMVVLLPKKSDGLPELEKALTPANLDAWLGKMKPTAMELDLPRFQATSEFRLKEELSRLGMADAFTPYVADLSGMGGKPGDLYISETVHKAFVSVTEEGTEAAAATGVVAKDTSETAVTFRADHPFLYLIRDNRTGGVLFLGRLADPRP
jgi:serpin B